MDKRSLENEPTMMHLFAVISPAKNTKLAYLTAMVQYTEFTGQTPTELINEAEQDIRAGKLMRERAIFFKIPQFRQYLENQKNPNTNKPLAPGTIEKYVSSVISFYKSFYIETPKQPRSKKKVKPVKENIKRIDKEGIRKAHEHANLRDRAISLCGISSGMGAAEIASLTLEAYRAGYDPETLITTFDMRREKVGKDFITFISPEATKAVDKYLEWRDRPPATQYKEDIEEYERRKTTPGSYLFISAKVRKEYLHTRNEEDRRLVPRAIVEVYQRISKNAGLCTPRGYFNVYRSHNMRKLFVKTLKNEGADSDIVEYFVGHTLDGAKDAYYEGDPGKLKVIYQKFIPFVTISKEVDVTSSSEYQEIKDKYETERAAKEHYKIERYELDKMLNDAVEKRLKEMLNGKI
ncbi:tyrosine-type recombinase/integrase [Methanolobus sp. WCC5]|uniref:tyrosine-type recombinase/integrase n=1 Tax=Methanolobus sp. WCC5 TaxID=3125785 RepID=UPI00324334EA